MLTPNDLKMLYTLFLTDEIMEKKAHVNVTSEEKRKLIPNGCKEWKIGKYTVVALNRKNAIRKALKLRNKKRLTND